jgi:hypothetical protein
MLRNIDLSAIYTNGVLDTLRKENLLNDYFFKYDEKGVKLIIKNIYDELNKNRKKFSSELKEKYEKDESVKIDVRHLFNEYNNIVTEETYVLNLIDYDYLTIHFTNRDVFTLKVSDVIDMFEPLFDDINSVKNGSKEVALNEIKKTILNNPEVKKHYNFSILSDKIKDELITVCEYSVEYINYPKKELFNKNSEKISILNEDGSRVEVNENNVLEIKDKDIFIKDNKEVEGEENKNKSKKLLKIDFSNEILIEELLAYYIANINNPNIRKYIDEQTSGILNNKFIIIELTRYLVDKNFLFISAKIDVKANIFETKNIVEDRGFELGLFYKYDFLKQGYFNQIHILHNIINKFNVSEENFFISLLKRNVDFLLNYNHKIYSYKNGYEFDYADISNRSLLSWGKEFELIYTSSDEGRGKIVDNFYKKYSWVDSIFPKAVSEYFLNKNINIERLLNEPKVPVDLLTPLELKYGLETPTAESLYKDIFISKLPISFVFKIYKDHKSSIFLNIETTTVNRVVEPLKNKYVHSFLKREELIEKQKREGLKEYERELLDDLNKVLDEYVVDIRSEIIDEIKDNGTYYSKAMGKVYDEEALKDKNELDKVVQAEYNERLKEQVDKYHKEYEEYKSNKEHAEKVKKAKRTYFNVYNECVEIHKKYIERLSSFLDEKFLLNAENSKINEYAYEFLSMVVWNIKNNNTIIYNKYKYPVFVSHKSKFKGDINFKLKDEQVSGVHFLVSNDNSGLLAHEVGFGKTTTSISFLSHLRNIGAIQNGLITVPTQVHEKWADEINGETSDKGIVFGFETMLVNKLKKDLKTKGVIVENKEISKKLEKFDINFFNNDNIDLDLETLDKFEEKLFSLKEDNELDSLMFNSDYMINLITHIVKNHIFSKKNIDDIFIEFNPNGLIGRRNFIEAKIEGYDVFSKMVILSPNLAKNLILSLDGILSYENIDKSKLKKELFENTGVEEYMEFSFKVSKNFIYDVLKKESNKEAFDIAARIYFRYLLATFISKLNPSSKSSKKTGGNTRIMKKYVLNFLYNSVNRNMLDDFRKLTNLDIITTDDFNETIYGKNDNIINDYISNNISTFFKKHYLKALDEYSYLQQRKYCISDKYKDKNILFVSTYNGLKEVGGSDFSKHAMQLMIDYTFEDKYLHMTQKELIIPSFDTNYGLNNYLFDSELKVYSDITDFDFFKTIGSKLTKSKHALYYRNSTDNDKTLLVNDVAMMNVYFSNITNPINIKSLNINTLIIDEVHNFNNNVFQVKTLSDFLMYSEKIVTSSRFSFDLPKLRPNASNMQPFILSYEIQTRNKFEGNSKNVVIMSATPFTTSVVEMLSVFRLANNESISSLGLDSPYSFLSTFIYKTYEIEADISGKITEKPAITKFKNDGLLKNLFNKNIDFKQISTSISRPEKINIPILVQNEKDMLGNKLDSFVPQNKAQEYFLQRISDYVAGDINFDMVKVFTKTQKNEIYLERLLNLMREDKGYLKELLKKYEIEFEKGDISEEDLMKIENIETIFDLGKIIDEQNFEEYEGKWAKLTTYQYGKSKNVSKTDDKTDDKTDSSEDSLEDNDVDILSNDDTVDLGVSIDDIDDIDEVYESVKNTSDINLKYEQLKYIVKKIYEIMSDDKVNEDDIEELKNKKELIESEYNSVLMDMYEKGLMKEEVTKIFAVLSLAQKMSISPYLVHEYIDINSLDFLPELNPESFVNFSPKFKFIYLAIKSEIVSQIKNNIVPNWDEVSGQIVHFRIKRFRYNGTEYDILKLFKGYVLHNLRKDLPKEIKGFDVSLIKDSIVDIIDGRTSDENLVEIRNNYNNGKIKVLFGTEKINEGIDLHVNSTAIYITAPSYNPTEQMQVEGRIWRQGNLWKFVKIFNVLTYDSADGFYYAKLSNKIERIRLMALMGEVNTDNSLFNIDTNEIKMRLIKNPKTKADYRILLDRMDIDENFDQVMASIDMFEQLKINANSFLTNKSKAIDYFNYLNNEFDVKNNAVKFLIKYFELVINSDKGSLFSNDFKSVKISEAIQSIIENDSELSEKYDAKLLEEHSYILSRDFKDLLGIGRALINGSITGNPEDLMNNILLFNELSESNVGDAYQRYEHLQKSYTDSMADIKILEHLKEIVKDTEDLNNDLFKIKSKAKELTILDVNTVKDKDLKEKLSKITQSGFVNKLTSGYLNLIDLKDFIKNELPKISKITNTFDSFLSTASIKTDPSFSLKLFSDIENEYMSYAEKQHGNVLTKKTLDKLSKLGVKNSDITTLAITIAKIQFIINFKILDYFTSLLDANQMYYFKSKNFDEALDRITNDINSQKEYNKFISEIYEVANKAKNGDKEENYIISYIFAVSTLINSYKELNTGEFEDENGQNTVSISEIEENINQYNTRLAELTEKRENIESNRDKYIIEYTRELELEKETGKFHIMDKINNLYKFNDEVLNFKTKLLNNKNK